MSQHVVHRPQAEAPQPLLELRPDQGEVGEREASQEFPFGTRFHNLDSVPRRPRQRLGDAGGELGDQAGGAAPDGHRQSGGFPHRGAHPPGGSRQRLVPVQPRRSRHVEVELVARCLLDRRRELLEHGLDLAALVGACLPRHRDHRRFGTEPDGPRHRHCGVDAVAAGLVGGRRDDAAALGGAADDEQQRLPRALRIDEAGDGHVERVGIGEEDTAR